MKIKNIALNSLFYFLYMFGSCFIVMVVEALLIYIIERFVIIPYPILTITRAVLYTLGVVVLMAVIGYYEGYREGYCSVGEIAVGGAGATLYHFIFSLLFNFQAFVSGSVRFTAALFAHGMNVTEELLVQKTPFTLTLLAFLLYAVIYVGTLTLSRYMGAQRRVIDRAELHIESSAIDNE